MSRKRILILAIILFGTSCSLLQIDPESGEDAESQTAEPHRPASSSTVEPSATPWPTLLPTPAGLQPSNDQSEAVLPGWVERIEQLKGATIYTIDLTIEIEPESNEAVLEGWVRIQYTNRSAQTLEDFVLMLWPNHEQYRAEMKAGPALVAGSQVDPIIEMDGLSLRIPLEPPLRPNEKMDVSIPFSVLAGGPLGGSRPERFGISQGSLIAPTFYPLVPRLVDGKWDQNAAAGAGDTVISDVSFYDVRIDAPAELALISSGVEIDKDLRGEMQIVTIVTGPVRDFALALGPFEQASRTVDGILLTSWVLPRNSGVQRSLLNAAQVQLATLNDVLGPYPYKELDLIDAPGGFAGLEYPGLIYLGTLSSSSYIAPAAHEIGHQWFYGLVGSDPMREPWLDEALATYSEIIYYENSSNPGRASWTIGRMRDQLRDLPDVGRPLGLPAEAFDSSDEYTGIIHLKGALFLETLRNLLGDRIFFESLEAYVDRYQFEIADTQNFQSIVERTCDCELDELFELWIYEGGALNIP